MDWPSSNLGLYYATFRGQMITLITYIQDTHAHIEVKTYRTPYLSDTACGMKEYVWSAGLQADTLAQAVELSKRPLCPACMRTWELLHIL